MSQSALTTTDSRPDNRGARAPAGRSRLLDTLRARGAMTPAQIAKALELSRTTAYKLLQELKTEGLIAAHRDTQGGRYGLVDEAPPAAREGGFKGWLAAHEEPADDASVLQVRQRCVEAARVGVDVPLGAVSNVFEAGKRAGASGAGAPRGKRPLFNADAVAIRHDVPLPAGGTSGSPYRRLLERMQAGDSVELRALQASGLVSAAKKHGVKVAQRRLGDGWVGVWRLA